MGVSTVINYKRKKYSSYNHHCYAIISVLLGHISFFTFSVLLEIRNLYEVNLNNPIFNLSFIPLTIIFVILNLWIYKKNYRFLYKKYSNKKWNLLKSFIMFIIPFIICLYHFYLRA